MAVTRIAVVGGGWRADFFTRLAQAIPDRFELVGITSRSAATVERLQSGLGVPGYASIGELVDGAAPDVLVIAVTASTNAALIVEAVSHRVAVLAETPPAESVADLRTLWRQAGTSGRVQIAEQYLALPGHAARLEIVRQGVIGRPTSVQVSSTHNYHAVAIIRGFLDAGFGPVAIRATARSAPLLDPLDRSGWITDPAEHDASNTIATLDFDSGLGLYDFTDNQWHNQLRHRRIVVRGSRGEIVDDSVLHMPAPKTILTSSIRRRQLGYDLDLDGYDTDHLSFEGSVVYRNDLVGHRLMDEEIAIATLMHQTGRWARDEAPAPYPLAEALQDQLLGLAITEAARTGHAVHTTREAWAPRAEP